MIGAAAKAAIDFASEIERRVIAIRSLRPDIEADQLIAWANERSRVSITHRALDYLEAMERAVVTGRPLPWELPADLEGYRLSEWLASNLRQS
ncbi:hypothetical protein [Pseudomonas chlororaphis]|uniref:hypothetical protein n=1 Tax=Pseudomonas chlororaphis TaxID=587753 RepID=UPI002366BCF3|nr:hypothetical protein [Pseudomonas chlororaphis]WDH24094.1 hypothetical protein PUP50_07350 [Pseudomonas chlororaphis]